MDYPGKVITKNQVTPTQTSASGVWTVDDAAAAVENNSWPVAGVPNPISRSLRFNSADSAYLNRTPATAGNRKTWTWSAWVKRSALGSAQQMFGASSSEYDTIGFDSSDRLRIYIYNATISTIRVSSQVFRDVGAWYHILVAFDSTNGTDQNRCRVYVNGSEITAWSTNNSITLNLDTSINNNVIHYVGRYGVSGGPEYFNGYLTEIHMVDGQALDPTYFGMTDPQTGAWIPKAYNGTYGTNGFYLNFSNNSSTAALGTDYSGNSNTWTTNNFSVTAGAGNDSLTDVPTPWIAYNTTGDVGGVVRGNYATLNPLHNSTAAPYITNGNLDFSEGTSLNVGTVPSTIYVSSGKWYYEVTCTSVQTNNYFLYFLTADGGAAGVRANASLVNVSGTGFSYTTNDVLSIALDVDSNSFEAFKNGVSQGTFTFSSSFSLISPAFSEGTSASGTTACSFNFGQRPFAYTPPAGFLSLCTTNLPTPTILDGGEYFNAVLYTGNGSTQNITGVGFEPGLVWVKNRSASSSQDWYDSVRGATNLLYSNGTDAEQTYSGVTAFNSNGFTLGSASGDNASGNSFVAWNWKAGGTPAVTNTDGTITSSVSVNTTSGFSIVTYTGNGSAGATVGHGLGVAPSMIIIKNRTDSASAFWCVYHRSAYVSGADPNVLYLNTTDAQADDTNVWGASPDFNSSTFELGDYNGSNGSGDSLVAYCFAAVPGYSAFGSYTGNGSTDGPFVYTGFRPRWVLVKKITASGTARSWVIWDTARNTFNVVNNRLYPNTNAAEDGSTNDIDILSNGIKIRNTGDEYNGSSTTYIYACFASSPFSIALAR